MASRLAEQYEVLLLEAGPKHHAWDFRVHMPAALSEVLTSTAYNYGFHTETEAELNNRRLYCPRGRVLGGSSSINGMILFGGTPATLTVGRRAMAALDGVISRCSHTSNVARIGPAVIHFSWAGWPATGSIIGCVGRA